MKKSMVEKVMNSKEAAKVVLDEGISKSAKIRQLFDGGWEIKDIAQAHIIMNDIVVEKNERNSKRDEIVKLLKDGMSLADISRQTKTNYNYIWKISKELKEDGITQTTTPTKTTKKSKNGPVTTYNLNDIKEKAL